MIDEHEKALMSPKPSEKIGTAHVAAAEIQLPIKGNRLKLLWATVCPWKREIRISVHVFIAAPPHQNADL